MYKAIHPCKMNNRGSTFIVVLAILSLLGVMGVAASSAALVNVQMRSMNRMSDKNFYKLEAIWDEIYQNLGITITEQVKEDYADILANLYKTYETNADANEALRNRFKTYIGTDLADASSAEDYLKSFYTASDCNQLAISIGSVTPLVNGRLLNDLSLTYTDPDTGYSSSITMNLEISVPDIRFIDNADIYSDYILIANGNINVGKTSERSNGIQTAITGNVRGKNLNITEQSTVSIEGNDIIVGGNSAESSGTSEGNLVVNGACNLTIGAETSGFDNNVWAGNIVLSGGNASFGTTSANLYVKDDLTVNGNSSTVSLQGGSYFGYGNEGAMSGTKTYNPAVSSAILLNGTGNHLTLDVNSLTLAGRSYLRISENLTYPMAESVAQRSTQSIYLIPAKEITIGENTAQTTNPFVIPSGTDSMTITIRHGSETGQSYTISLDSTKSDEMIAGDSHDKVVFLKKTTKGITRLYVFYHVNYLNEGSEEVNLKSFFRTLLSTDENSSLFQSLLQKGDNIIDIFNAPGVTTGMGNIASAGAIYRETSDDTNGYTILNTSSTSTLETVSSIAMLKSNYEKLSTTLSRTGRLSDAVRTRENQPAGQYVNADKISGVILLSENGSVTKFENATKAEVAGKNGIILAGTSGVQLTGSGEFDGLVISLGDIAVSGDLTLKADADVVRACIEKDAESYFADVCSQASTVFNDYSYFVHESDWYRGRKTAASSDNVENGEDE